MIPIDSESQKEEILAVADLIKSEVNVKEIQVLDDASDILVKQIKPNFKVLGPRFGQDMKAVANVVNNCTADDIKKIEQKGILDVQINGKSITLERGDVEITSQDIEGWLVASQGALTVALDVTLTDELKKEEILKRCKNPFDLVNSAIKVTRDVMETGKGHEAGYFNYAYQVLSHIHNGDYGFQDGVIVIPEEEPQEEEGEVDL